MSMTLFVPKELVILKWIKLRGLKEGNTPMGFCGGGGLVTTFFNKITFELCIPVSIVFCDSCFARSFFSSFNLFKT